MVERGDGGEVQEARRVPETDDSEAHEPLRSDDEKPVRYRSSHQRRRRRLLHTLALAAVSGALGAAADIWARSRGARSSASVSSAYAAMPLICFTMLHGPIASLRGRRTPISADVRRDAGLLATACAAVHVVAALGDHFGGVVRRYFFDNGGVRVDRFGWMSWSGVAASAVFVVLAATSNDLAVRSLRTRWKTVQRSVHALLALSLGHGVLAAGLLHRRRALMFAPVIAVGAVYGVRIAAKRTAQSVR